ncbi:MAG TPA: hypothetical protein VFW04_12610 [Gemmatimonadaceae bacterium]|nr:hypothetical protein [Gemmatimonadaceae bacterium]
MSSRLWLCQGVAAALAVSMAIACTDVNRPTGLTANAVDRNAAAQRTVKVNILDNCDSATYNAAVGPGTCDRAGGIKFPQFINLVGAHQALASYRFAPAGFTVHVGQTIAAMNMGGETHTFTRVSSFGGGLVPLLNQLSGNNTVVPECLTIPGSEFLAPGQTDVESVDAPGTALFQCCIHPWMRAVVQVVP